ncbi:hypothetical protein JOC85_003804 [Bacillus mesophilus]|nr:hypothetical protein [Bacillus mesophilus]
MNKDNKKEPMFSSGELVEHQLKGYYGMDSE